MFSEIVNAEGSGSQQDPYRGVVELGISDLADMYVEVGTQFKIQVSGSGTYASLSGDDIGLKLEYDSDFGGYYLQGSVNNSGVLRLSLDDGRFTRSYTITAMGSTTMEKLEFLSSPLDDGVIDFV